MSNPYPAQQALLQSKIYLSSTGHYGTQLILLSVLLALLTIVQIASLALRWQKGTFWTFRTTRVKNGVFLVPHSIVMWTIFSTIFLGVLQAFLYSVKSYGMPGSDLHNVFLPRGLVWIPLWIGAWCMTWATLLAPALSRPTSSTNSTQSRLAQYPLVVNAFFLSIPLILCATVVPLTISINNTFNSSFKDYRALNTLLAKASINFQNGIQASQADLVTMGILNGKLEASFLLLVSRWSNLFTAWAVFVGIMGLIFTIASTIHFRSLGHAMSFIKIKQQNVAAHDEQSSSLRSAYRSLVLTSSLVAIMAGTYFSMNLILATRAADIASGSKLDEFVILGLIYLFVFFGGIASITIFIRSFSSHSPTTSLSVGGASTQAFELTRPRVNTPTYSFAQTVIIKDESVGDDASKPFELSLRRQDIPREKYSSGGPFNV